MSDFTKNISIASWVEAVCGVKNDTINHWAEYFLNNGLFENIKGDLNTFCRAQDEPHRYEPFAAILKKTLAFSVEAKDELQGISGTLPVDDIVFIPHNDKVLRGSEEHGKRLASDRKPDILVARKRDKDLAELEKKRMHWSSAVMCMELKFVHGLSGQFKNELRKRGDHAGSEVAVETESGFGDNLDILEAIPTVQASYAAVVDLVASTEELDMSETASTGSKRSRGSETASSSRPPKKSKQSGSSSQPKESNIAASVLSMEEQIGGYALEMLSSTKGTRLHSIIVGLRDDLVSLWYFDASGVVRTCSPESKEKLSLVYDFERVAAIFVALSYCRPQQFGAIQTDIIVPPSSTPFPDSFPLKNLGGCTIDMTTADAKKKRDREPFVITLGRSIYNQYALTGRHTTVYEGTTPAVPEGVILKFSQQYIKRASEVMLIKKARKHNVEHLPEILKSKDFWRLSHSTRKLFGVGYEDRVFRGIAMPLYLPLVEQLRKNPDSLTTMVKQMIKCLHGLRNDAHILHRDISGGNIMYKGVIDGQDWFILNDFDLAVFVKKNGQPLGPSSHHRTGTLPFMAQELVADMAKSRSPRFPKREPIQHCIRHDYESLFWVSLWHAINLVSPDLKTNRALQEDRLQYLAEWEGNNLGNAANLKELLLISASKFKDAPLSPSFEHLGKWLDAFREPFSKAQLKCTARTKPFMNFETHETGDGHVTRDTLMKSIEEYEMQQAMSQQEEEEEHEEYEEYEESQEEEAVEESSTSDEDDDSEDD